MPKFYGEDKWTESEVYNELRTAKAWGLTPRQWYNEDLDSRAAMIAFEMTESNIQAAIAYSDKVKSKTKKK